MKKLIGDRMYDTDKAKKIMCWDNGKGSPNYISETLYRKRTGEYFLYCVGGSDTKYSVVTGDNIWDGCEQILPLFYDDAEKWASKRMSKNGYDEEFGEVKQNDNLEMVTVSMKVSDAEMLRRAARASDLKLSEYVAKIARMHIQV